MVSSKAWALGWHRPVTMDTTDVILRRLEDDSDFVCLLIMQGLLFTCFLLSQFCLSLITASKESYRVSVVDPNSTWRPLRVRRMSRDTRAHAPPSYTRIYKLQNQCSLKFIQIFGSKVNADGPINSNFTDLRFQSVSSRHVTIEAVRYPDNYLCFNRRGRLVIGQFGYRRKRCKFIEEMTEDQHTMFRSAANTRWRIGFKKKKGKPLMGYDTKRKDDCFKFQKVGNTLYSEVIEEGRHTPAIFYKGFQRHVEKTSRTPESERAGVKRGRRKGRQRARARARSRRRQNKERDNT